MKNQFGLSRYVPADIARQIRQRCGFGCVVCGLAFYDYEHFAPDFADATEHNPDGMTLLCSQCNQKRARGRLSADTVARFNANPKCKEDGYSSELFDFGLDPITIKFAGATIYNCRHAIVVNEIPILTISPPKELGSPILLSGQFTDERGRVTLTIVDNVFSVISENWDVECVGPRIKIRSEKGLISLVLRMDPPLGLAIERLMMQFQGVFFEGDENTLKISTDGKNWSTFSQVTISNCFSGIAVSTRPRAANDLVYELQ